MFSNAKMYTLFDRGSFLAVIAAFGFVSTAASAQAVYRIVGADGKVTYADRPPAASSGSKNTNTLGNDLGNNASGVGLPYELAQIANKYPVTIYTREDCTPCDSGRALLKNRGIPFKEKTVQTPQDLQALQSISADTSMPLLTIGSQQIQGYSSTEWTQFLDAAGYPQSSALPAGYRSPTAPLTTPKASSEPATNATQATAATATLRGPRASRPEPSTPVTPPDNPSGIRF